MLSKTFLSTGRDEPLPERIPLRAGPLEMIFEQGDLRAIRFGEREILRRVYVAIRDHNWGTLQAQLSNVSLRIEENAFAIDYDVENRQGEIDFAWHGAIEGTPDGRITFSMDGAARSTFHKNRIGFCVLFPASSAGQEVLLEHVDGTREQTIFPVDISADQPVRPFENIRAMTLPLGSAGKAAVRFVGDVFEMEDQRLWTDASYKVFCTPLSLPYPVAIQAGTRVAQKVELFLHAPVTTGQTEMPIVDHRSPGSAAFSLPPGSAWKPMPLLGLGSASHEQELTPGEIERLKALHLHHLRVDLPLADPDYPTRLQRAVSEAAALGIELEMALLVTAENAEEELRELRGHLDLLRPPVCCWLVYPAQEIWAGGSPTGAVLRAARHHLEDYRPGTPFAAGTNTDFIFLKRTPPPVTMMDRVCIALNPQVHAFDDLSLVETLETQPVVVESARRLAGGLPVMVSPITLKPRSNPYATGPAPRIQPDTLPPQVDPRQRSLFGAGWTLGSLRGMVSGEAVSVTYYETIGWRGVMERENGSPWPRIYPSLPGVVYPLYHILADVGEFGGGQAALLASSGDRAADQRVSGLAIRLGGQVSVLLANHTAEPQHVVMDGLEGRWFARALDETTVEQAMFSPEVYRQEPGKTLASQDLVIHPYGFIRIDRQLK